MTREELEVCARLAADLGAAVKQRDRALALLRELDESDPGEWCDRRRELLAEVDK